MPDANRLGMSTLPQSRCSSGIRGDAVDGTWAPSRTSHGRFPQPLWKSLCERAEFYIAVAPIPKVLAFCTRTGRDDPDTPSVSAAVRLIRLQARPLPTPGSGRRIVKTHRPRMLALRTEKQLLAKLFVRADRASGFARRTRRQRAGAWIA